jgi:hypothetical protein
MKEKQMIVTVIYFKRNEKSKLEKGIAVLIDGNVQLIIDANGKSVSFNIWDFNLHYESGCINIKV